jgi:very-short-patch-repair endonuclease
MSKSTPISRFRRATAQRLRARQTSAEVRLWKLLHRIELHGTHFRRQVPIGPYVADFACMANRIVIEVDGSHHGEQAAAERDRKRTAWLQAQGFRVLRFWNNDLIANPEGVLHVINAAIGDADGWETARLASTATQSSPHPGAQARRPSPSRGG